jgi:MoxR-like ATPase
MTNPRPEAAYKRLIRFDSKPAAAGSRETVPDRRDGLVYVSDPPLELAAEVALATGRPLLLTGEPGSGKSSFAAYTARCLGWKYYEHVVTARSEVQDLFYRFDTVRRLNDAMARQGAPLVDFDYVSPGVLWWVFDRRSAIKRGAPSVPAMASIEPGGATNSRRSESGAVLLIDEIDKADPDFANGLLVPLGSWEFTVEELGLKVNTPLAPATKPSRLLVVITSNGERELPPAFLRRCVVHRLIYPDSERLLQIARWHFEAPGSSFSEAEVALILGVIERVRALREEAAVQGQRPPSVGEYLDAVRACRNLGVTYDSPTWQLIECIALRKRDV